MTEFLHDDEGPITRGNRPPNVDAATRAACVFGFERLSNRTHAHYVLEVEPTDRDKTKVEHPEIKVLFRVSIAGRNTRAPTRQAPTSGSA